MKKTIAGTILTLTTLLGLAQKPTTLEQAINEALNNNINIKNREIILEREEIRYEINRRDLYFPNLNTAVRGAQNFLDQGKFSTSFSLYTGISIFDMSRKPRMRKLNINIQRQEIHLTHAQANIYRDVTITYFNTKLTSKQIELRKQQIHEITEILDETKKDNAFYEEAQQYFNPKLLELETKIKDLEIQYDINQIQLKRLLNKNNNEELVLLTQLYVPEKIEKKETQEKIIREAIQTQTEIDRLAQQDSYEDKKIAQARVYPIISAGVQYLNEFMPAPYEGALLRLDLTMSPFKWGNTRREKEIVNKNKQITQNNMDQRKLDLENNTQTNIARLNQNLTRADSNTVNAYKQSYETLRNGINPKTNLHLLLDRMDRYYEAKIQQNNFINVAIHQEQIIRALIQDFNTPLNQIKYQN